jgi:Protein of unknown function (DUF3810)
MQWRPVVSSSIVVAAIAVAVVEAPERAVRLYGEWFYPRLQATLTPISNGTSLPLFDLAWLGIVLAVVVMLWLAVQRAWRARDVRVLVATLVTIVTIAAGTYLWFVLAWGYNYRRPAVEGALPGFTPARVTPEAVRALAEHAVLRANELYAAAHGQGFPAASDVPVALLDSLHAVERSLGRRSPTRPSVPKRPLTAPYMRAVGVSGMLAPLMLETYLNPDLTAPERPYVLAHEWAHLSGFAPEEDASFVGVLAALRADVPAQYSAWLFLVSEAAMRLPVATRREVLAPLGEGPRRDLDAIAERLRDRVPWLDRASWVAYDRAIKSQGAESGVAGYGRVIELLLGSGALDGEGILW